MRVQIEERQTFFPWEVKEQLLKETGGKCAHCGTPLDRYENLTVEHIIPISRGGTNDVSNLTVLCPGCNLEKFDMVLGPYWYYYLPKGRRKAITEAMTAYIERMDYLTESCVMCVDGFQLQVYVHSAAKARGRKSYNIPVYIDVTRMDDLAAFDWLTEYKKSLQWRDARTVIEHPSKFRGRCYILRKGDIDVAMITPHISRTWSEEAKAYANTVCTDWFFSPGMPDKPHVHGMLMETVQGMTHYIGMVLNSTMKGTAIVVLRNRCYLSDQFCGPVFELLKPTTNVMTEEFATSGSLTARIMLSSTCAVLGTKDAPKEEVRALEQLIDRGVTLADIAKHSKALNDRLEASMKEGGT